MKLIVKLIIAVFVLGLLYIAYRTYYRLSPEQNAMASKMREICKSKGFEHDGSFVYHMGISEIQEEGDSDKEARAKGVEFACKRYFGARCKDAYNGLCHRNKTENETRRQIEMECRLFDPSSPYNFGLRSKGHRRVYEQATAAITDICEDINK
jgi:hypothetical protein